MFSFFFFNDTATTEIYTLSLHDALPISGCRTRWPNWSRSTPSPLAWGSTSTASSECDSLRSEEHTSELQSRLHLVCRLLLEKKKKKQYRNLTTPTHVINCTRPQLRRLIS